MKACLLVFVVGLSLACVWAVEDASPSNSAPRNGPTEHPVVHSRPTKVDLNSLRAEAHALRSRRSRSKDQNEAREVLVAEAEVLIRLAASKDDTLSARRREVVDELKRDDKLPQTEKLRLVAASLNVDVVADRTLSPDQRMSAYADVAWRLVHEFPENPERYASLLRIARDSSDSQARSIANRILSSDAPPEVKAQARKVLQRIALIGCSLSEIAGVRLVDTAPDSTICLFSWSVRNPQSLTLSRLVKEGLGSRTKFVAVCIEGDAETAKAVVDAYDPTIESIIPDGGAESELCRRLMIDGPAVYLADASGKIATVSGLNSVSTRLWTKRNGGAK